METKLDENKLKVEKSEDNPGLSKRQQKKLAKHEKWLQFRGERRAKEKEARKKRKSLASTLGLPEGPNRKLLKSSTMANSDCHTRVVIDLSFDNLMTEKDIKKTVKQVQNCYALNRRLRSPLQLYLTNIGGRIQQQMESVQGHMNWDVHYKKEDFKDLFPKHEIIYLTSDSPNVITELDDNHVYIIGGLVDHNHHKGLCYKLAQDNNLAHARLPIDDHVKLSSRHVLTINHVFDILSTWTVNRSWKEALLKVLPNRVNATPKSPPPIENK